MEADKLVGKHFIIFQELPDGGVCYNYGKVLDKVDGLSYFVRMLSWARPANVLRSKVDMHFLEDGPNTTFWHFFDSEEEMQEEIDWLKRPIEDTKETNITTFKRKV